MAEEPLFRDQLAHHPEYKRHAGSFGTTGSVEALIDASVPRGGTEGGLSWDPYAFTLTCEACHAVMHAGSSGASAMV